MQAFVYMLNEIIRTYGEDEEAKEYGLAFVAAENGDLMSADAEWARE